MNVNDISKIWLTSDAIWIETTDGRQASEQFRDYARLEKATPDQRSDYTTSHFGIHWPALDEDLSFAGFFKHTSH